MINVFFRCILGVPPLMLILLPVVSPACEERNLTTILIHYQNVIHSDFKYLEEMLMNSVNNSCCTPQNQEDLCNENKELDSIFTMSCSALRLCKKGVRKHIRHSVRTACETMNTALKCTCVPEVMFRSRKGDGRKPKGHRSSCSVNLCKLKEIIFALNSCWQKLYARVSEDIQL
nr:PREDICTED: interleukin-7 [Latimeria chalumnae]|eukprot:XP_006013335.1 PREDICTED: interleukin-7 [Latimeria chalumnae]